MAWISTLNHPSHCKLFTISSFFPETLIELNSNQIITTGVHFSWYIKLRLTSVSKEKYKEITKMQWRNLKIFLSRTNLCIEHPWVNGIQIWFKWRVIIIYFHGEIMKIHNWHPFKKFFSRTIGLVRGGVFVNKLRTMIQIPIRIEKMNFSKSTLCYNDSFAQMCFVIDLNGFLGERCCPTC